MPNHKSAEKRHRQSLKRRARNRSTKSAMRTLIKKARNSAELVLSDRNPAELDTKAVRLQESQAQRSIAKAASKGIVHKRTAARLTSRLAKSVNKSLPA